MTNMMSMNTNDILNTTNNTMENKKLNSNTSNLHASLVQSQQAQVAQELLKLSPNPMNQLLSQQTLINTMAQQQALLELQRQNYARNLILRQQQQQLLLNPALFGNSSLLQSMLAQNSLTQQLYSTQTPTTPELPQQQTNPLLQSLNLGLQEQPSIPTTPTVTKPAPKTKVRKKKICKNPTCTTYAKGGGFCIRHGGGKRCSVPNCDRLARFAGSLCYSHGVTKKKHQAKMELKNEKASNNKITSVKNEYTIIKRPIEETGAADDSIKQPRKKVKEEEVHKATI